MTAPHGSFRYMPPGWAQDRKRGGMEGMEGKLNEISEVNTRAVFRGQNKLTGEFKMAAGDVINFRA